MAQNSESPTSELMGNISCTPRNRANLRRLKATSIQSFQRWEKENELLYAMIEDESTWLSALFPEEFITADLFFYALEDGTTLCLLANFIQEMAEQYSHKTGRPVPGKKFTFNRKKKGIRQSKLFHSRDNVEKFLSWCRLHGIPEAILFESNDVVLVDECRTGGREIVICLMEIARRCSSYEIQQLPQLIRLEREIDEEESNDSKYTTNIGEPLTIHINNSELQEDRSPIDSDSGVESVFEEGVDTTSPHLMEFTLDDQHIKENKNVDSNKFEGQKPSKEQKQLSSLLESTCPKTELDEKVCKIAKDYNIKIIHRLKEGKYIILGKTMFVRMLNDHLLVRIGGGWDTLEHYVMTHSSKPTVGENFNPTTPTLESRSRKGSSVWSKLVEKVKRRDSQPDFTASPVISKKPRPDSSPASYRLRDRLKKRLSVDENDGQDISHAIQKIESSLLQTPNSSSSPSFTSKTFFQLKSRFDRGRKNSRENLSEKKFTAMEELNTGLNGDIKQQEGQERGSENVQHGTNDLFMSGIEETTSTSTTLIDIQESTTASSPSTQHLGDILQPKPTADDLFFGDGQTPEQSNVQPTFLSKEISPEKSGLLLQSDPLQAEQSEVNRPVGTTMYSFHKEEMNFERVSPEGQEALKGGEMIDLPVVTEFKPLDPCHEDHPVTEIESTPVLESLSNLQEKDQSTCKAEDQSIEVEPQPETQEEPQTLEMAMDSECKIDGQTTEHVESQPAVSEELQTPEKAMNNVEHVCQEQSAEHVEPQPTIPEEPQIPEKAIDSIASVHMADVQSTEQVETQPAGLEELQNPQSEINYNVDKADEQSTEQVETQPEAQEEPQTPEKVLDSVESVYRADDQSTAEQVETEPADPEELQAPETAINYNVDKADEQSTEQVETQPEAQEESQTPEKVLDSVESVYRADDQLTAEQVETEPADPEELQAPETAINYNVDKADEQSTEQVETPTAAQELQTPEMAVGNVEKACMPDDQSTEQVEQQTAVPKENGFTEATKPIEPESFALEKVDLESAPLPPDKHAERSASPAANKPSEVASQVIAEEAKNFHTEPILTASKPGKGAVQSKPQKAPQSSMAKHDKADTKATSSKTTSAVKKQAKPQSATAARPQSSKMSKVKTTTSSAQSSSSATKKTSAKSHQLSTVPSKPAPEKSQGVSKSTTSPTKPNSTTKKPSAAASTKPAATSTKPTATSTKPAAASTRPAATSTKPAAASTKPAATSTKPAAASAKPAATSTKPAAASTRPATTSKPAASSSRSDTSSSKPATTRSKPASARPSSTKDKKPTRPPSAPVTETKTNVSKTRPQCGKNAQPKSADKTDGKAPSSLGRASGKSPASGSSKTTVKQVTTVTKSTHDPTSKSTTKSNKNVTTSRTTVKETKAPTQQQGKAAHSKPGSATAKPKATGASARPTSPTKGAGKKTATTKDEKPVHAMESQAAQPSTDLAPEGTTETDGAITKVIEHTHTEVTEDGGVHVTTVLEVTESVSTNGEQQLIMTEIVVEESG